MYHDGQAPYGAWNVADAYVNQRWHAGAVVMVPIVSDTVPGIAVRHAVLGLVSGTG